MKVTFIPIISGAFGPITKILIKGRENLEIKRRVATIFLMARSGFPEILVWNKKTNDKQSYTFERASLGVV